MRPSWIEIDLAAVGSNIGAIRRAVAPAAVCAVVKADAYGHGDVPVAEAAIEAGAAWLAVALVEEGIRLREAGIEAPILLLSEPPVSDGSEILAWRLTPTVYRAEFAAALEEAAGGSRLDVHLKVDTGMHRVGADPAGVAGLAELIARSPVLRLQGLWTHLAVAEEDVDFTGEQVATLAALIDELAARGIDVPMVHVANSAGGLLHPGARFDMVRAGIAVYGLSPAPGMDIGVDLLPVMRVVSEVAMVRRLPAGARPSYGRRRRLEHDATVATVPIGYADGLSRRLGEVGGEVLLGGRRRPLAGTVTMDQIVVEVGDDPVSVGDEVVLIGRQGDDVITADEWAARLGTINYEVVCGFGPRLPRRYRR